MCVCVAPPETPSAGQRDYADARGLSLFECRQISNDGTHHDCEIVGVRLDEIMPCDRRRIDVMLAKWTDESGTDNGDLDGAPCVTEPMAEAG